MENVRQKPQNGRGEVRGRHLFAAAGRSENIAFKMIVEMAL